jgi:DNA-binding XRE family transcriptional regulator
LHDGNDNAAKMFPNHSLFRSNMKVNQKSRVDTELAQALAGIGEALRGYRLVKRLTQEQAAEQAGFSRQTLSRIERGDPSVAFGQVARYAEVVGAQRMLSLPVPRKVNPEQRRVRLSQSERARVQSKQAAPAVA